MLIKTLSIWLRNNGHIKAAQQVEELDWDEPWHEEAVKEFGDTIEEDTIDESKYFIQSKPGETDMAPVSPVTYQEYDPEPYNGVLEKEGFKMVQNSKDPLLGVGAGGIVYDGIWNGKPAVAKVSLYNVSDEVGIWKKILEASKAGSDNLRKHIPIIYHMNQDSGANPPYEIIVMEKLYPLSRQMRDLIRGYFEESSQSKLQEPEYIWTVSKQIADALKELKTMNTIMADPLEIYNILISANMFADDYSSNIYTDISRYIIDTEPSIIENKERGMVDRLIGKMLRLGFFPQGFPTNNTRIYRKKEDGSTEKNPQEYSPIWGELPETSSYYKAIEELLVDFNIEWQDIHENNIMTDRDGNLKIIDVALFT